MTPRSSTFAWKIPWMEDPGRLQPMGSLESLEKEMATHSSVLAWRVPGMGEAWWAAVSGVAQSRTRLK